MKPPQFFITLILASICVVLSLASIWLGHSGIKLQDDVNKEQIDIQADLQKRQEVINLGNQSQQIANSILKDIAATAYNTQTGQVRNEKLKELLVRNGINVQVNPQPTPATTR